MDEPIKVLHVLGSLHRGGAETMVMNLYRNIDRSQVQFDFIVHTKEEFDFTKEIKKLGGKIFYIPPFNLKNIFIYKKAWNKFFSEHPEYKIIHGHVRSTASIYMKIAQKYGVMTIAHSHSTSSGKGISAIVKNTLQYRIRYIADYLFACSRNSGEWLYGKTACQRDNFYVLNNAIETSRYIYDAAIRKEKRKEFNIENKLVLGHVGRFDMAKNHEFLIDVFKSVHDKNKDSVLILVGDGSLRQSIENKVEKLGLTNNIIFTGVRSDVPELLNAIDLFVFPSIYEGLPVTIVEVQAAGLPCIMSDRITDEVIVTELVEKFPIESSAEKWAEKILELNKKYDRKSQIEKIKDAGYDVEESTKWLENFYRRIYELQNNVRSLAWNKS